MPAGTGTGTYDAMPSPDAVMPTASPLMSPASWVGFLEAKLDLQAAACKAPEDYYNGRHRLIFATAKFREAFGRFFPPMANNWMKIIVDAPVSRLRLQGFRFNTTPGAAAWDQEADQDAWAIWQANNLDAGADIAHTEAIKLGVVNVLVSPPLPDEEPLITIEHPSQTYVYCDPANRRKRLAAIKRWLGADGYAYLTLYLPDTVYKFKSTAKTRTAPTKGSVQWTNRQDDPVENNPLGVVPMVPLENNPDLMWGGRSDLEVAMPLQDAINKLCLDMQVSSEFNAFPQRWATGWEEGYDRDGKVVDPSVAMGQSRLVTAKGENTHFGDFAQGQVANYIQPIDLYIDHLAGITQTPSYYLKQGKMANLSADALHAADAGFVDRINRKIRSFGDGWEEVMRVAFLAKGDKTRGAAKSAESIWQDPETKSLSILVDAGLKMRQGLSVPLEMVWEDLGWSPQKIQMAKKMMNLPNSPADAALGPIAETTTPGGIVLPRGVGGLPAQQAPAVPAGAR